MCSEPVLGFGPGDSTPLLSDWGAFLGVRQNRDNVFFVVCRELKEQLNAIEEAAMSEARGEEVGLSPLQSHLRNLDITIDGEPEPSRDYKTTLAHSSWRTTGGGIIQLLEKNGIGEGEGQAIHHARIRSQADAGVNTVELMSVDTDQWVMAFLHFAVGQHEVGSTRIVVRQQTGINWWGDHRCIDARKVYDSIVSLPIWPHEFLPVARSLPLVVAFVLSGTNVTPLLSSITVFHKFSSYCEFATCAHNWPFVLPLSTHHGGSKEAFKADLHECMKFVRLSYFKTHRALFANKDPGHQVRNGAAGVTSHDALKPLVLALHERTAEKKTVNGALKDAIPVFHVLEEHVKRFFWVVEYWYSMMFGEETRYPIMVPDYVGKGYEKDSDGTVLMVMRREPKVTLRPGEGIHVERCKCAPIPDGTTNARKCTTCSCRNHTSSQLCGCNRTCMSGLVTPLEGNEQGDGTPQGLNEPDDGMGALPGEADNHDKSDSSDSDDSDEGTPNTYTPYL